MLYELSKRPDIQEKVYKHVTSVLGSTNKIDGEVLHMMPYLGYVIKETQRFVDVKSKVQNILVIVYRMTPVSPNHIRTVTKDINLLGYNIPAQVSMQCN